MNFNSITIHKTLHNECYMGNYIGIKAGSEIRFQIPKFLNPPYNFSHKGLRILKGVSDHFNIIQLFSQDDLFKLKNEYLKLHRSGRIK